MKEFSGDNGEGETPDPIPNSEVKPFSADGTARETVWESRTLPGIIRKALLKNRAFFFRYRDSR